MLLVAIAACEIGFWVLLALGLLTRYALKWRRLSTVLLLALPVVDLALLAFTVIDLRRGADVTAAHALAAVYLGFSVAFGHDLVRWADVRVAHRFAGGPPPPPKPESGTPERVRKEWRDWLHALAGFVVAVALIGVMALLVRGHSSVGPLFTPIPGMGGALAIWLIGWPLWESSKAGKRARVGRS